MTHDIAHDIAHDNTATAEAAERPAQRKLTPQAERALAEAAERRAQAAAREAATPKELGGRGGLEPVRYGDWEIKGIACDF